MELKNVSTETLIANDYGLRKNAMSLAPLMTSIKEYGFICPIIVNKNNVVICGNNRLEAAKLLHLESVPIIVVDLDENKTKQYALVDNQVQQLSGWNFSKKKEMVENEKIDSGKYGMSDEMRSIVDIDSFFTEDDAISLFEL